MKVLDEIQKFEKDFIAAGRLALEMREDAKISQKMDSGIKEVDIVTSADLAVQEYILERLSKSKILKSCELLAEETTGFMDGYAEKSDLVLTLDPIDGTYLYATGKKMYKVIVGIHDKKNPLYTFCYFPEYAWGLKIVGKKSEFFGKKPKFNLKMDIPSKAIVYGIHGDRPKIDKSNPDLYKKLTDEGYSFIEREKISDDRSTSGQFLVLSDKLDGYFSTDICSSVDTLVVLHFGIANNYRIIRTIDISNPVVGKHGGVGCYKGYYLILKK